MNQQIIDIGDMVVCDICNEDYTDNTLATGGFIFQSQAVCPTCSPRFLDSIEKYKEQRFIRTHCKQFQTFADFVREYRGDDKFILIVGDDSTD